MRTRLGVVVVIVGLGTGAIATVVACGGDDASSNKDAGADAAQDGSSMMDATIGDGAGMDTGIGNDGGDGATPGDGSAPEGSTPNSILCGNVSCILPANICCSTALNDGGTSKTCLPEGQCQGTKSECDDRTDCPNNQRCCLKFNNNLVEGTCSNNCGNDPQLCVVSSECANNMTCTAYTCPMNQAVKTCSKPNNCN